jgi:hypothetical protein
MREIVIAGIIGGIVGGLISPIVVVLTLAAGILNRNGQSQSEPQ